MAFPGSLPSYTTPTPTETLAADGHTARHIAEEADITALGTKMGTGSSTPTNQKLLRGNGVGTSAWAQVDLTTDVTAVLPQANGGTGTTLATGTGKAVYDTAPTISNPTLTGGGSWSGSPSLTTPTIASFTNATHNHSNAAGGGQLSASAFPNNAITAPLLSTSAITLGYVQITGDVTTTSATAVQITGLTLTVTIPDGGRSIKITGHVPAAFTSGANSVSILIYDGAVPAGTLLCEAPYGTTDITVPFTATAFAVVQGLSAGSKTYNLGFKINGGSTFHTGSTTTTAAFLLVEAI